GRGRHRAQPGRRRHAATVAPGHEGGVRRGEAEDGVMEREAEPGADEEEGAVPWAVARREPEGADREEACGARGDRHLDGRVGEYGRRGGDGWDDATHRDGGSPRARRSISISTSRL